MMTAAKTAARVLRRIGAVQGLANLHKLRGEGIVRGSLVTRYSAGLFIGCHCGIFIAVSVIG